MVNALMKLFTPPRFLAMPAPGIEISDAFVRALSFSGAPGNLRVAWWEETALPTGAVVGGVISDKKAVIEILKKMRSAHRFSFAHIALPEQQVYLFEMSAPVVSNEETHAAIELRLEEHVPVRSTEAVFDFDMQRANAGAPGVERLFRVAVASRRTSEMYASVCEEAGIAPLSFDSEANAVARAGVGIHDPRAILVAHLSEDDTGLYIVSDGAVRFASTVPLSAEKLASDPAAQEALASEAARVCSFWEAHRDKKSRAIESVVACGRGAAFPRILSALSSTLHITAEPALVWGNAFSLERTVPSLPRDESLRFSVPAGLALRSFIYV